jgi:sporulation protein YlmC with PRC-barrel domain
MKRFTSSLCALSLAVLIPATALAQTSTTDKRSTDRAAKRERPAFNATQGLHETGDIIGAKVEAPDGKNLGKVDALLIDPKEGKVSHAVIGMGGVLGVGNEKVVVPYTDLKMTGHEGGRKGRITIDQSTLDSAPKYVKATDRAPSASPVTSPRPLSERSDRATDRKQ